MSVIHHHYTIPWNKKKKKKKNNETPFVHFALEHLIINHTELITKSLISLPPIIPCFSQESWEKVIYMKSNRCQRCCFDSVREWEREKKSSWHGMINVRQRWKWLLPDLIWNAVPVPLNLTDLVTYSLVLSDTLLYGLKVWSVASCSYLYSPMCNFWHFHSTHRALHWMSVQGRLGYGGVGVFFCFALFCFEKIMTLLKQIQAQTHVQVVYATLWLSWPRAKANKAI